MRIVNNAAHLVTLTTEEENTSVSAMTDDIVFIGLSQNLNSSEYSEPSGGWEWITGKS